MANDLTYLDATMKKIDKTQANAFTGCFGVFNMCLPLPQAAVGIRPPHKGAKTPLTNVVFLYPSKNTGAVMRGRLSVMVGCFRQPVKRLVASFGDRSNLIQSTAKSLDPFDGGLFPLFKG